MLTVKRRPQNIRLWRIFSSRLVGELPRIPLALYWFRWEGETPNAKQHDLPRLMRLSTSPTVNFITHLTLHKVWMFRASDLMALADMRNLGILELSDLVGQEQHDADGAEGETTEIVESCLNDRLVRGWSEKDKPFPNLRVLAMTSVHSSVTLLTLQYATRFPCLVYCLLRSVSLPDHRRTASEQAEALGWRMQPSPKSWGFDVPEWIAEDMCWAESALRDPSDEHGIARQQLECFDALPEGGVHLRPCAAIASSTPPETCQTCPKDADSLRRYYLFHGVLRTFEWLIWSHYSAVGEQIGNADLVDQGVELDRRATHLSRSMGSQIPGSEERSHKSCGCAVLPPKPMLSVVLGRPGSFYHNHKHNLADLWFRPGDYKGSLLRALGPRGHDYVPMKEYIFVRDYSRSMTEPTDIGSATTKKANARRSRKETRSSTKGKETAGGSIFKPRKRRDLGDLLGYASVEGAGSEGTRPSSEL